MKMIKILYACNNTINSHLQAERILSNINKSKYQIKIAAYLNKGPFGIKNSDWTLNALLDFSRPNHLSIENNSNFLLYLDQIKYYNPDLIISDMEYFTSYAAQILNIRLWQCSPYLLNFALNKVDKYNLGFHKRYVYLEKNFFLRQRFLNIINNSERNFVYSHLGDAGIALTNTFDWIKPYYKLGKVSKPCQHKLVGISPRPAPQILKILSKHQDSILFTYDKHNYNNITVKRLNNYNEQEYYCNIKNADVLLCGGEPIYLADAYYNNKYIFIHSLIDIVNEYLPHVILNEKIGLSQLIYDDVDFSFYHTQSVNYTTDRNILFLHEKLEEL